jgi:hypothetical protein
MSIDEGETISLHPRNHWEAIGTVLTELICSYLEPRKKPQLCHLSLLTWTRVSEKVQLVPPTALHKYLHLCDL